MIGPPEFQLAIDCCSFAFRESGRSLRAPAAPFDWPLFLEIVQFHRIAGLACACFVASRFPDVPVRALALTANDAAATAAAALRASAACANLGTEFERGHVRLVFLKKVSHLAHSLMVTPR